MLLDVGSNNRNVTVDLWTGEEVFLCRCGEVHRGSYGRYDRNMHECFHPGPLLLHPDALHVLCGECGMIWSLEALPMSGTPRSKAAE